MPRVKLVLAVLALLVLSGCVPWYRTDVTAYAKPGIPTQTRFVLQGPDPSQLGGDPRWPVFADMLIKALVAKDFVFDPTSPQLVIRATYRMGDSQVYTYSETTTNADGTPGPTTTSSYETATYSVQLVALDPASLSTRAPVILWRTHAEMRGATADMAEMFPYLVASMKNYFGVTVPEKVTVVKSKNDLEVGFLKERK